MERSFNKEVTTVVYHKINLDMVDEYLNWQERITKASKEFKGFIDATLIQPGVLTRNQNEYVLIYKFENQRRLDKWLASTDRRELLKEAERFTTSEPHLRFFTGLEHWFLELKEDVPPRYKMTVVSFFAIWPLVHFFPPLFEPLLIYDALVNEMILTGIITVGMSYVALPLMTIVFKTWLAKR